MKKEFYRATIQLAFANINKAFESLSSRQANDKIGLLRLLPQYSVKRTAENHSEASWNCKSGIFAIHDLFTKSNYGDMDILLRTLKKKGRLDMLFSKIIHKRFDAVLGRYDGDPAIRYASVSDFPELKRQCFDVNGDRNVTLKGWFYFYGSFQPENLIVFDHGIGAGTATRRNLPIGGSLTRYWTV